MDIPRLKVKARTKAILWEWLFIVIVVNVLMFGYYFIAWWGLKDYLKPLAFDDYLNSGYIYLEVFIQSTMFGILFGVVNYIADKTRIKRFSFGGLILTKTLLYSIAILLAQVFVFIVYHLFQIMNVETMIELQQMANFRFIFSISLFFLFVVFFLSFLLHINRKFGPRTLFYLISGKYYKPRQERRIFMFVDMRDSTGIAQRLGNYNYSLLIKECIHVISDLILRYKAEVYQYVGDEIVLTWPTRRGINDQNCLNIYFAFLQRLNDKKEWFMKRFGTVPHFKAGIDEGMVTVTEVGDIKRELAYHGDVLHTAARLEKMCNKLECNVLMTKSLNNQLDENPSLEIEFLGDYLLRGKGQKDKVFCVRRVS